MNLNFKELAGAWFGDNSEDRFNLFRGYFMILLLMICMIKFDWFNSHLSGINNMQIETILQIWGGSG